MLTPRWVKARKSSIEDDVTALPFGSSERELSWEEGRNHASTFRWSSGCELYSLSQF
jgi:hypothetical protein